MFVSTFFHWWKRRKRGTGFEHLRGLDGIEAASAASAAVASAAVAVEDGKVDVRAAGWC